MSAFANLAQLCRLLAFQVHNFFEELLQLVIRGLSTGGYCPPRAVGATRLPGFPWEYFTAIIEAIDEDRNYVVLDGQTIILEVIDVEQSEDDVIEGYDNYDFEFEYEFH
ncbi:hypothetical protein KR018_001080 [Drosophila ironensis]|nr:hypothetical protein KR018_001080 [Drosophila ironensis]